MSDTPSQTSQPPVGDSVNIGPALLAAALALPMMGQALAETAPDRGLVGLKYLNYQDSQPGDPRIHVNASQFTVLKPLSSDWSVGATLTQDAISGASPSYHTTALRQMHDNRHAMEASATRFLPNGSVTLGTSLSIETDYVARGVSLQASRSDDTKNSTWTLGLGYSSDLINPTNGIVANETKQVASALLGWTQVLTRADILQLNLGLVQGRGYFSDPYKVSDNRPRIHNSQTIMARWNHQFESVDSTLRLSYRYYNDSWSIRAHTLGAEYAGSLGNGWTLTPLARLYTQSAANFYVNAEPVASPFGPVIPVGATFFSEDQRVSAFGAHTFGLKLARRLDGDWTLDVKFEQYLQRSAWRLFGNGSPNLAPFSARSIQAGVARAF